MANKTEDFAQAKQRIFDLAQRLDSELSDERREQRKNAIRALEENQFNVAVVGQIKAGKSTFLNAMFERPEFLPVDVNPWTAVITRIHFGKPGGPENGATFRFFSKEEWRELVEVGENRKHRAQLEKVAEKETLAVHPKKRDETTGELEREREKLEKRARARLGTKLEVLLGREHPYKSLDGRLLKQYLCTGDAPDTSDSENSDAGRYSDITREADIFLPMEPFTEYTVFVDTPGTNDPFQLRSDITLEYLNEAHAFVLVFSAHQALTGHDQELLERLLHTLHKDRLMVFVNQMDRLNDPIREIPRVLDRVRGEIGRAFPEFTIPVVSGSAWWAERALARDERLKGWLFDDKFVSWGLHHKCFTEEDIERWKAKPDEYWSEIVEATVRASGIPQVREVIERILLKERGYKLLEEAVNALANIAESAAEERAQQASARDGMIEKIRQGAEEAEKEKAKIKEEIEKLEFRKDALQEMIRKTEDGLSKCVEELCRNLKDTVSQKLRKFANQEARKLREKGISIFDDREWSADMNSLRGEMARAFREKYEQIRKEFQQKQKYFEMKARLELQKVGFDSASSPELVQVQDIDPDPSLTELARNVNVDLGGWWTRLWSGEKEARKKSYELEEKLKEAFEPVVRGLVSRTEGALRKACEQFIRLLDLVIHDAVNRLEEELKAREHRLIQLLKATDAASLEKEISKIEAEAQDLRSKAKVLRDIGRQLRNVV